MFPGAKQELPPRTRRILTPWGDSIQLNGTTSAYAENTGIKWAWNTLGENYLRVRGEYALVESGDPLKMELPPRTRRIPLLRIRNLLSLGTTSAYAENTAGLRFSSSNMRNYLRVRGEYKSTIKAPRCDLELPPRTRRILESLFGGGSEVGTTSAYAENTILPGQHPNRKWNYLRVRGEYGLLTPPYLRAPELPPRTRRIQLLGVPPQTVAGTTSAYAENTRHHGASTSRNWNYLRVRGEYLPSASNAWIPMELPPRTRRIRLLDIL